jgi:hypothetical protein
VPEQHLAHDRARQPRQVAGEVDDQIVHGEHPDELPAGDQWQAADRSILEDLERVPEIGVGGQGDQVGRHHGVDAGIGARAPGDGPDDEVAVGDDPDWPAVRLDDHQGADGAAIHRLGRLGDRVITGDGGRALARRLDGMHGAPPCCRSRVS